MNLNLDIYLSGYVQKLYKIKPTNIPKASDITLRTEWWSLWRCEHLVSDPEDKHLFVFTNAASYFTIIVYQEGLSLDTMLLRFNQELLYRLRQFGPSLPPKIKAQTRIIKGNPRSFISVMNNIIHSIDVKLFERKIGYDQTEIEINMTPCGGPDYLFPRDEFERLLTESPIGIENNIIDFPPSNNK